ncbi:hypothetical protein L218DRAFT_993537 [Marasmius fiardii PR-910]|nr:hypothetical protein L218DRAFT_993537 [Marasmius fiardii PR-910]
MLLAFVLSTLSLTSLPVVCAAIPPGRTFVSGAWILIQQGLVYTIPSGPRDYSRRDHSTTGVSALELAVVSETAVLILDKVEHNPLKVNGHIAWGSEFNLETKQARPLNPLSNTWCASGSFLGNGTFISTGGNPVVITGSTAGPLTRVYTDIWYLPGLNGLQGLRMFTPCSDGNCDIFEDPSRIRLTSPRWYPSSIRIEDGSVIIWGGSTIGGYINGVAVNNPSYEFFPPKNIHGFNGLKIPSQFMVDTLNGNHFPVLAQLPDGNIFVAANQAAMLFDWKTNTETRLPDIPNGVRISSPFSAGSVVLPLTPENNYTPEILICGGSTVSDQASASSVSSQTPASAQCSRMVLTAAGIAAGWEVESMPMPRLMADLVLLPDGRVLIVNGAQTGVPGYGTAPDPVGHSNADNPALTPVIYDPAAPAGSRFTSSGVPATSIPRMYHSTASLTPNGSVLLAGSNPNDDFTTGTIFPTEYRAEFYSPPHTSQPRPTYTGLPATVNFGTKFELSVSLPPGTNNVSGVSTLPFDSITVFSCGDRPRFSTHGVHMDPRSIKLTSSLSASKKTLTVIGPPSGNHYPLGPAFIYVVTDAGVPSFGHKTLIGTGASPPVDQGAIDNLLRMTSGPQLDQHGNLTNGLGVSQQL